MNTAEKLDDFAHDACVSGLCIAFLCVVSVAGFRTASRADRLPKTDPPAPVTVERAPQIADVSVLAADAR